MDVSIRCHITELSKEPWFYCGIKIWLTFGPKLLSRITVKIVRITKTPKYRIGVFFGNVSFTVHFHQLVEFLLDDCSQVSVSFSSPGGSPFTFCFLATATVAGVTANMMDPEVLFVLQEVVCGKNAGGRGNILTYCLCCRAVQIQTNGPSKDRPWIVRRTHKHESNMIQRVR
jgi:hypothetical protein